MSLILTISRLAPSSTMMICRELQRNRVTKRRLTSFLFSSSNGIVIDFVGGTPKASQLLRNSVSSAADLSRDGLSHHSPFRRCACPTSVLRVIVTMRMLLGVVPGLKHALATPQMLIARTATKKAGGSTRNGRDSNPKMLGVKVLYPKGVCLR